MAAENRYLKAELARVTAKLNAANALLARLGHSEAKTVTLALVDAVSDFLKSGTGAGARYVEHMRSTLDGFADYQGPTVRASNVTPDDVIKYLEFKKQKCKGNRLKKIAKEVCKMLEWATGGTFRRQPVKDWCRRNAKSVGTTPYWLDSGDVERLIDALPSEWRGPVWLQWAAGLRPEELCRVEGRNLREVAGEMSVRIASVVRDGKTYWTPKTNRSIGVVNLPLWANRPLSRLVGLETASGFLFEKNGQPWELVPWTTEYLKQLRDAAEVAKLDKKRVDGRTLRRSCGKRVLLASIQEKGTGNAI